jgi:mRNA interferase MazF
MKKGKIILVPFPFTDLKGRKIRPAIVLVNKESDVIIAFISTQINSREKLDIIIEPNINNGLKKTSIIRISKLITLHKDLILGEIGEIDSKMHEVLNKNLMGLFNLN